MNNWYVVKTKPKKENDVQNQLEKACYETFLPKIRGILSLKPLFPSYLFIRTDFQDPFHHRLVRFTRGIYRILGDREGPQPIAETIINILKEKAINGSLIEQELLFKERDPVRVKRGILKDLIGIVQKNLPDTARVKILFKWLNSTMYAVLRYTELEKVA